MTVPQEVKGARHDALLDDDGHAYAADVNYNNLISGSAETDVQGELDALEAAVAAIPPPDPGTYPASPITIRYTFSTTTTDADPGAGLLRLSNATQYLAVAVRADLADVDGADVTALLATIADWLSTTKGYVRLQHETDATKWLVGTVSAIASPSGYRNITIANIAKSANSPFANADPIIVSFVPGTLAHAATHLAGGADLIKLDDLAAPDDNTDLNASTSAHGLLKKLPGGTTTFLRADGTFATVPGGGGGVAADGYTSYAGSGGATIPGLRGDPAVLPASPSAFDDEFEALSGWTTLGTLDVSNVSDFPSHWRAERLTPTSNEVNGIYKTAPSMPFTVTMKIAGLHFGANISYVGLLLTEASPGKLFTWGPAYATGFGAWNDMIPNQWTNRTTRGTSSDNNFVTYLYNEWPRYIRMVVTSSTSVTCSVSMDGYLFAGPAYVAGQNPGLTVANVGLFVASLGGVSTPRMVVDWIRFT